ncbi:MAG TPA: hypothetical protein ENH15_05625, partial [Actinobacteria bacterium]|nr:hypothetical protein [Actinomycetota bacterium]
MKIIRTQRFIATLKALQKGDDELFVAVAADLRYLIELKRGAQLPQVRFGLAQSEYDVIGEVRSHITGRPEFIRVLFAMPHDESLCAFLIMGDKNSQREGAPS